MVSWSFLVHLRYSFLISFLYPRLFDCVCFKYSQVLVIILFSKPQIQFCLLKFSRPSKRCSPSLMLPLLANLTFIRVTMSTLYFGSSLGIIALFLSGLFELGLSIVVFIFHVTRLRFYFVPFYSGRHPTEVNGRFSTTPKKRYFFYSKRRKWLLFKNI